MTGLLQWTAVDDPERARSCPPTGRSRFDAWRASATRSSSPTTTRCPTIQDVADHVGDSLGLSRIAASADASTIVFCGVHFMAETAKILSYDKTVLIPDARAGCSLADTITARRSCGRGRPSTPAPSS